jgi:hypothetical protein
MIRSISIEFAVAATPFVLYAAFLYLTSVGVLHPPAWTVRRVSALFIASLILVIGSFVVLANFSGSPPNSNYVPAHLENGRLVPGTTK